MTVKAEKNITMAEVAKRANVAINTASKVFRGDPTVRSYIRSRVLAEAKKANYSTNVLAQAMRTKKFNLVSFHIANFKNPFFGNLFELVSEKLGQKGIMVVQCNGVDKLNETNQSTFACATILANSKADKIKQVVRTTPLITINSYEPDAKLSSGVYIDYEQAYIRLAKRVLKHGRKKIGYYCLDEDFGPNKRKYNNITKILKDANLQVVHHGKPAFESIDEIIISQKKHGLDAIFCVNDIVAAKLSIELLKNGIKIPEDVLIIGSDGTFDCSDMWTVKVDTDHLADITVRLLFETLKHKKEHEQINLMPELITPGYNETLTS